MVKTDNAACFRNDQYRNFLKSQSIKPEFVTPYVHTGNGTVERTIGTIDSYIKIFLNENFSLEDTVLKLLKVLRFTYHSAINKTPFEMQYGRKPDTKLSVIFNKISEILANPDAEINVLVSDLNNMNIGVFQYPAKNQLRRESSSQWGTEVIRDLPGTSTSKDQARVKYFKKKTTLKEI